MRKGLWMFVGMSVLVWAVLFPAVVHGQETLPCDPNQMQSLAEKLLREGSLTITMMEDEANACLQKYQRVIQRRTPFRSLEVDFRPGIVRVVGQLRWFSLTLDIEPYVENGQIRIRLQGVRIGFLPLPTFLFRSYVERANAELARTFARPPLSYLDIQYLNVTDDGLALSVGLHR